MKFRLKSIYKENKIKKYNKNMGIENISEILPEWQGGKGEDKRNMYRKAIDNTG